MDTETAFTTPTTAFVTDWTRLAWRLSPAIQSISRPARFAVITFRFMPDYDDLHHAELPALNEGISQGKDTKDGHECRACEHARSPLRGGARQVEVLLPALGLADGLAQVVGDFLPAVQFAFVHGSVP